MLVFIVKKFTIYAWNVTCFIRVFLQWVYCADGAHPTAVDFVGDEARARWACFIRMVREASNQSATARHLSLEFVVGFLQERAADLKKLRDGLKELEEKYLS